MVLTVGLLSRPRPLLLPRESNPAIRTIEVHGFHGEADTVSGLGQKTTESNEHQLTACGGGRRDTI